ncbi:acyl-CoA/acyl-ACP dehydrogenase [Nocardia sp. NBC_00508]|uniref:acyl-CoA dehydrogenase family protein n=1 Tax=Nocardia sp. NBC_00508 TaxID=2975992 RepID=UPI002E80A5A9|nr:acyl-CoA dehydrogenase family protein [Nocardia sp. NBC_00508]WUD67107.1 acyl-CoA/acyl-ACP dehydrogenase [Nocardia sp. NBC_00508]
MEFGFSVEQEELRRTVRDLLAKEAGPAPFRAALDASDHSPDALWQRVSDELGWCGICVPVSAGGLGLGMVELAIVQEEAGRALFGTPFFSTVCLATPLVAESGSGPVQENFLRGVATGGLCATAALIEPTGRWDAAGVEACATRSGDSWRLSGCKSFVTDAHLADEIVVLARTHPSEAPEDGLSLFLVPAELLVRPPEVMDSLDNTRRLCRVFLDGVDIPAERLLGAPGAGWQILEAAMDRMAVAVAAEAVGVGAQAVDMATGYAKQRVQFDRPIGSYQAIGHRCVDMFAAVEAARSAVYFAAWAIDEMAPEARPAAATAKVAGGEAGHLAAAGCVQVHGGIGFTWEHDAHLFYRRAQFCRMFLGDASRWRDRIAVLALTG